MLNEVSTDEGAKQISVRMEDILKKEGYYDGKKALRQ
jgi:multiple sugar transport system substrate-binding protein